MSRAKKPGSYHVTIDHVTYEDFPNHGEILPLSTNLIRSFLCFMKELGICSHENLEKALGAKTPEDIDAILRKTRMSFDEAGVSSDYEKQTFVIWQKKVLYDDPRDYKISLRETLNCVIARNKFFKLDAYKHEVYLKLRKLQKTLNASEVKTDVGKGIAINFAEVDRICRNCRLKVIDDWKEAKNHPDYLHALLIDYFPHVTYQMFKDYLFGDTVVAPRTIFDFCSNHGIERYNRQFSRRFLEEHLAFVKWTGGDPEAFIAKERSRIWSRKNL